MMVIIKETEERLIEKCEVLSCSVYLLFGTALLKQCGRNLVSTTHYVQLVSSNDRSYFCFILNNDAH
jgi:hypothetical protein